LLAYLCHAIIFTSRCLGINFYSDLTIKDFERHVTIFML
jgi:hypothetical protein